MYYYLYTSDMYLEEIDYEDNKLNYVKFSNKDKELRAAIKYFDTADEIRKIVFIELGVELKIGKMKLFGKEEE